MSAVVVGHWFNGWFMRLFGRAYLVVADEELPVAWGRPTPVQLPDAPVRIGAGVRYLDRGPLLGCEPQAYEGHLGTRGTEALRVTLRNGFWNHSPFRLVP
ncbi:hypothetical protein [Actinotalea sp. C106]|uniref:hypothetical protein n=1 Tax=Actinotalea sp. C106 TaxID=2908644 RepID=UPI002027CFFF|nr:hypothetical protein [Actinotalea sp. C106]